MSDQSSDTMTVGPLTIDTARRLVFVDGERVDLTKREFDLLAVLAENAGVVLSAASGCSSWCGATTSTSTPTWPTCSSATCGASSNAMGCPGDPHGARDRLRAAGRAVSAPPPSVRSPSLRTRVALAAAAAAAAVVAVFTILTSVVLANNDAAQLDRRLDSIVEASMYPDQLSDPRQGVLTTGRMESTGQVVFQRGLQLPPLQPGTADVVVNGVDYRVRTIPVEQQGGVLMSIGIRADSILLNRARIPFYVAVGVVAVLIAAGLGWLLSGPAIRPLRRLTEQTRRLGKGTEQMPEVHGVREAEELSEAMVGDAQQVGRRAAGHHELAAGRAGFRGERRARVAHTADRDARRPGHATHPRPARR